MAEQFSDRLEYLFKQALTDATMTQPGGVGALFDATIFDVRLGGDNAVNGSNNQITLPLEKVIVTIGSPYGIEHGYSGDTDVDCEFWIPFKVWGNTGADTEDFETRVDFARQHRTNVFSAFGFTLLNGIVRRRPIQYDPNKGLVVREFAWRVFWTRP